MRFENVTLASIGYALPDCATASSEIEDRLAPVYERLKLPKGRLELMTGIVQRRFWDAATLPSEMSVRSGRAALQAAGVDPHHLGCLIHGSVCRDHLEPATACRVHHELDLPAECMVYDISNACLGLLSGMWQLAALIELGQIKAGLVVGTENGQSLVDTTVRSLLGNERLSRQQIKAAIASLTIGSASAAMLMCHRDLTPGSRLTDCSALAKSAHHGLCQSDRDDAVGAGMQPLMDTDSEQLMLAGVAAAEVCYQRFMAEAPGGRRLDKTVCHQVGAAHRRLLLARLNIDPALDFVTYPWLGNTGSAALPVTLAAAATAGHFAADDSIGLLGIGSGINVVMMRLTYERLAIAGHGTLGMLDT